MCWRTCCCREGINIFLAGFVPTENLRFREESLTFKVAEQQMEEDVKKFARFQYPDMTKTQVGRISSLLSCRPFCTPLICHDLEWFARCQYPDMTKMHLGQIVSLLLCRSLCTP